MRENFATKALPELYKLEGYKSDLKGDTGGATIRGISSRWFPKAYQQVMDKINAGLFDDAEEIISNFYLNNFWIPLGADALAFPLDCDAFIEAVNDGEHGVLEALKTCKDAESFLAWADQHYKNIVSAKPQYAKFLQGWLSRTRLIEQAFGYGA